MSKYLIVVLMSVGITFIVNAYIIIKTSPDRLKRIWANFFFLGGMILFFWGVSETAVKLIDYLFKLVKIIVTMVKFNA